MTGIEGERLVDSYPRICILSEYAACECSNTSYAELNIMVI